MKIRTDWIGVFAVALLLACGLALAETTPQRGAADGRIRVAPYRPDEVYRLYGYVGYALELVFEEGETFAGNGGGDLEALTFGHFSNHLIIKPRAPSVGTNLVIYTTKRAYRIDYSATAKKPDPRIDPIMYAVQFSYPVEKSDKPDPEEVKRALDREAALRPKNLDYWFCGSADLRPVAASDDGVRTRLTFGAKAEMPAIFLANSDGTESLLNFSVENGDVLIQRVAPRFVLRRGKLTGCVVNKSFSGGGERLESGTLAAGVERERKGNAP
jgi:type IV secretion system protein VirB9